MAGYISTWHAAIETVLTTEGYTAAPSLDTLSSSRKNKGYYIQLTDIASEPVGTINQEWLQCAFSVYMFTQISANSENTKMKELEDVLENVLKALNSSDNYVTATYHGKFSIGSITAEYSDNAILANIKVVAEGMYETD